MKAIYPMLRAKLSALLDRLLGPYRWLVRPVLLGALVGVVIGVVVAYTRPVTYTSTVTFFPRAKRSSELAGLAAQFGVMTGGGSEGAGQSPAYFANLLTTTSVLERVVGRQYVLTTPQGPRTIDLVTYLREGRPATSAVDTALAIRRLRGMIDVINQRATGLVAFSVTTPSAPLSFAISTQLVSQLNEYNLAARRDGAAAERRFMEQVRNTSAQELDDAEVALRRFLEANRNMGNSPMLAYEKERLNRRVMLAQQLFASLEQSADQARIDEVRDTPSITVVEEPRMPAIANSRHLTSYGLGGVLLGAAVFALIALLARPELSTQTLTVSRPTKAMVP